MFNSIIILDNYSIHKVSGVREAILQSGHILNFIPPYSPQLNHIEEFFSKWGHLIKALNPKTNQQLEDAIQIAQPRFAC